MKNKPTKLENEIATIICEHIASNHLSEKMIFDKHYLAMARKILRAIKKTA